MDDLIVHIGEWTKVLRVRQSGSSLGATDLYLNTPCGRKLRSTPSLTNYIKHHNLYDIDPRKVNFEKPLRPGEKPKPCYSKFTTEFIKFVRSRGKYTPSYAIPGDQRPKKKKKLRVKINLKTIDKDWCDKCRRLDYVREDAATLCKLCEGCILCQQGKYDYEIEHLPSTSIYI